MATQKGSRDGQGAGNQHQHQPQLRPEPAHEEAGELDAGLGGIGSLSTGHAGSLQSEREPAPGPGLGEKRDR